MASFLSAISTNNLLPSRSDLEYLLEELSLPHVYTIISLGFGASIGLELLKGRPSISSSFIGIDFAIPDSPVMLRQRAIHKRALRSSLARRVGMGILVDKAVSNWFTVDARGSLEWARVRKMIAAGNIEGMEKLSNAALESVGHDGTVQIGKELLENLQLSALFICGSGDSVLPEEMEAYPPGGHEKRERNIQINSQDLSPSFHKKPDEFVDVVKNWLNNLT